MTIVDNDGINKDNDSVLNKVNFFHILKKLEPIGLLSGNRSHALH
jgi:hypothetical protein